MVIETLYNCTYLCILEKLGNVVRDKFYFSLRIDHK